MFSDHYSINFKDRFKAILSNACAVISIISSKEIKPYVWISTASLQKDKNQSNFASINSGQIQMHVAAENSS